MPELWLVVEVSSVVDRGGVERAVRRAGYLRQIGYAVLPAVAGGQDSEGALLVLDGSIFFWEGLLSHLPAA